MVPRGRIDGLFIFLISIYFSWASILLRSVNPCLLQGKMCDRGGIELLQSKNENGWRSLDWHQPQRISFSGPVSMRGHMIRHKLLHWYDLLEGEGWNELPILRASWTQLKCWDTFHPFYEEYLAALLRTAGQLLGEGLCLGTEKGVLMYYY